MPSHKVTAISAINDRLIPKDENDRSIPYYHWWPKQGTIEWISYELPQETLVASATVYWFDDAPWVVAECLKHGGFIIKIRQENGVLCKMQIRME